MKRKKTYGLPLLLSVIMSLLLGVLITTPAAFAQSAKQSAVSTSAHTIAPSTSQGKQGTSNVTQATGRGKSVQESRRLIRVTRYERITKRIPVTRYVRITKVVPIIRYVHITKVLPITRYRTITKLIRVTRVERVFQRKKVKGCNC